ncbi:hypothetical protein Nepgr_017810 [Nepenthes gracilis]|uniref:Pentatricopeptide repeat-containing protein n=1 Tax=Nepenthes gracilis TaxID=150966 RepID=A0AAD3SSC5_NEPGR|nr:hypothetical protein Nepgr_017810 [Nepenthes gracilis]
MNKTSNVSWVFIKPWSVRCFRFFSESSSLRRFLQHSATTIPACNTFLQSCAQHSDITKGKELHSWMLRNNFLTSPLSITSLINMYSKCNHMSYASSVFEISSHLHNVYTYNAIIAGFIGNNLYREGFDLYFHMRYEGITPDKFTFPCAIKGCPEVLEVQKVHSLLFKFGLELDVFIGSALISCYLKFGAVDSAHDVFDELPERDAVLWNSMINGYVQIGEFELALQMFKRMGEDGIVPNNITATGVLSALAMNESLYNGRVIHAFVIKKGQDSILAVSNALIDMYGKCKCVETAVEIFEMIAEKDIFSWNSIISIHELSGDHHGAVRLFGMMLCAGIDPDLVTITTVLPACAHLAALMHGREIHRYMIAKGLGNNGNVNDFDDMYVNNALVDMYAKCGNMRCAHTVFEKTSVKDLASWNIMIMGYGMHGHGNEALSMFDRMCAEKLKPDEVTFVAVLSACSHAGLLSHGREYLWQMEPTYGVTPTIEHYVCVIDMLGRAGQLVEAYQLLLTMPIQSNAVAWRAFLSTCELQGNSHLAEVAAQHIFKLEPEHCGNYVLMSNVYGAAGRFEEVSEVRLTMLEQNIKKVPGCSWVEVNNNVRVFFTGDRAHPQAALIYKRLDALLAPLCEHGYMPAI